MSGPFFLQTERLGFRRWSTEDLPLARALWGDPAVTRLIGGPLSRDQVQERLARERATQKSQGMQYWPLFLLATGEPIGCCGLRPYKPTIPELGAHLKEAHWGKGYAQEAARAVIDYAFQTLGATALFAGHNPHNTASRSLLLKLGFRYTHDEHYPATGLEHPSYLLAPIGL